MLSDARNLWKSASNAFVAFNENISNVLEKIDAEASQIVSARDDETSHAEDLNLSNESKFQVEDCQLELDLYKKLLDESQLCQVELSNQSRLLVAEKDAELKTLRRLLESNNIDIRSSSLSSLSSSSNNATSAPHPADTVSEKSSMEFERLLAEKNALEASLVHIQEQLHESFALQSSMKILQEKQNSYQEKVKSLTLENTSMQQRLTQLEKTKSETIDGLAEEYSRLAADSEVRHLNDKSMIAKLSTENEELLIKMEALQHNINEFADRAAAVTVAINSSAAVTNSSNGNAISTLSANESSSIHDSIPTTGNTGSSNSNSNGVNTSLAQAELKEARHKLINIQYDIRSKDEEIARLSQLLAQASITSSQPSSSDTTIQPTSLPSSQPSVLPILTTTTASQTKELETCKAELENVKSDNLRLQVEKEEALKAGKMSFEQVVELKKQVKSFAESSAVIEERLISTQALLKTSEEKSEALVIQIAEVSEQLHTVKSECVSQKTNHQVELDRLSNQYTEKLANLSADWDVKLEEKSSVIVEQTKAMTAMKVAHESELQQWMGKVQQSNTIRVDLEGQITTLRDTAEEEKKTLRGQIDDLNSQLTNITAKVDETVKVKLAEAEAQLRENYQCALETVKKEAKLQIDAANVESDEFRELYTKESKLRKSIHNKLLELQGNIRVVCRVRPILDVERRMGEDVDVTEFPSENELSIQRDPVTKARYEYDCVFTPTSTQELVFQSVQPVCVSVLDGYNACIFAYGQTGSGKTFTMEGSIENPGVAPRAISEIFRIISDLESEWTYTVSFSMLEIYNESIYDLSVSSSGSGAKDKEKLDIRQGPDGNIVPGLVEHSVHSAEQVAELMKLGQSNRAVGSHDMNEHSSRSHSILTLVCRGKNKMDGQSTIGKLYLIDLAGSERVSKTDASGERLKEAQNINRSLSALGDVISALGSKKPGHVPYRNSKLPFLLQDSLGGNSKTLMFVNISPAIYNLGETVCSLNFASRCRNVELGQAKRQVNTTADSSISASSSSSSVAAMSGGVSSSVGAVLGVSSSSSTGANANANTVGGSNVNRMSTSSTVGGSRKTTSNS